MKTASIRQRRSRVRAGVVATGLALSLGLSACATPSSGDGGSAGGESVPVGATKDEYVAALADMDEVTLSVQVPASPGHVSSLPQEHYKEVVEEWSGGKIQIEISYGNPIVPSPEAIEAMGDGRLDLGSIYPLYDPARYPASNALVDASFVGQHTPLVGTLQATAAYTEATFETPEIREELEEQGVHLLLPLIASDSPTLNCTSQRATLDELEGVQTRVSGTVHTRQAEALGMSPVSIEYTEIYEALQRGTVDCALVMLRVADLGGFLELAPHATIDPDAGFAYTPVPVGFSQDRWESLPLAAQQLLFDKSRDYLGEYFYSVFGGTKDALRAAEESGGSVSELGPEAEEALQAENEKILADVAGSDGLSDGDAFVDTVTGSADKWLKIVTDELGYPADVSYAEFGSWYQRDKVDLEPYLNRLWQDVMLEQRPS